MSIPFGDILKHNNLLYPIVDINDVKGGLRSIATFSNTDLYNAFNNIPEKLKTNYTTLLITSTNEYYYLSDTDPTVTTSWALVGSGISGSGVTNSITKWTGTSILGVSNITDDGDTVTINGNLLVMGTTSTVNTENLLVKDPIILLSASQSGIPTLDSGFFINRGSDVTQAFIWDESMTEFKFISTTSGATVSGDVLIGTYSNVRSGVLKVGTGDIDSNDRFVVSSSDGTVSLVVNESGYVYNSGRGGLSTNTAFGLMSLGSNTTGYNNTSVGNNSLIANTSGYKNTSVGNSSLYSNTFGYNNTSIGEQALYSNSFGYNNTSIGTQTLYSNTFGYNNTSIGYRTLYNNINGYKNIGIGELSLYNNTNGIRNIAMGEQTMYYNTTGWSNVGIGHAALQYNTTSDRNIGIGSLTMKYYKGFWSLGVGGAALYKASTGILQLTATFSSGSGYTPGTYSDVRLYYSSGTYWSSTDPDGYPSASIVVGAGGTVSSVTLKNRGVLISDTTTRFRVNTGTYSYQLGTASGNGFEIGIDTIATADLNISLGHGSLYNLGVGSDNIALGMWAGVHYSNGSDNLTGADRSIFIGRFSRALLNNTINEIVIGNDAIGNGPHTVTLGNNDVLKTYLKGSLQLPTVPTTSVGTYSILTRNDITGEVEKIPIQSYKVYTALISQSGIADPTITILENTIGSIVWTRTTTGAYKGTLLGTFTTSKTIAFISGSQLIYSDPTFYDIRRFDDNSVILSTYKSGINTDTMLSNTSIEIRVYN